MTKYFWTAAMAVVLAAPIGAQVTVTTGSPTDGVSPLGKDSDFGPIPTAMAQTFVLPGGTNYLQTFSLFITGGFGGGTSLQLAASVYRFDVDHLVGPALFFSGLFNGTDDPLTDVELKFGASVPLNLLLSPGVTYALVLSTVEGYATTPDHSTVTGGASLVDAYAGGSLFITTLTDELDLFDPAAFSDAASPDAAFSATFTAGLVTPEPPSTALVATGLIGVGGLVRRRRRRNT